jgi:hypothetical protein
MSDTTPRRVAGNVISEHRTSHGLVRYRWWPGWISVELLDEPTTILAVASAPATVSVAEDGAERGVHGEAHRHHRQDPRG